MNSLSWMIYLAGVSEGLQVLLFVSGSLAGVGGMVAILANALEGEGEKVWLLAKRTALIAIPLFLVGIAVPNQNTVYAIATSEMGESALKSETGGKAVKALNAWLDRQIAGESEAK